MGFLNSQPAGEDGVMQPRAAAGEIENEAHEQTMDGAKRNDIVRSTGTSDFDEKPTDNEFLQMVREAESQANLYVAQVNRKSWARTYRAFHQEHFTGSKYQSREYDNRSKLFIPKTRAAIRKDLAAVAASLFGSIDAVNCMAGDEANPFQRASAAVVQEIVNYRTDRSNGKAAIPWFHVALGARQTSQLTGICLSKQSWRLDLRRAGSEEVDVEDEETGDTIKAQRDVWVPDVDRPDCQLIPPENFDIDPAADWTDPAQDAAYIILKWPMRIDEIRRKQYDPRMPWKELPESVLKSGSNSKEMDQQAIRRAREQGLDRYDESQTGQTFDIIWVYETFMRTAGEDWTFLSVGHKHMLTEPKPVREVYPEQFGRRPLVYGIGSFEAFRLFPMSNAESWQMLQMEANDLRNLTLDAIKQNVMPVTKVVRGRQIDLDQLKRRGQGTAIMVNNKDDVTWEKVPDVSSGTQMMKQQLDIEFDDLAGQQNYGTVQDNNALGKTLGGLKLAAGAANAVQEFDIRVWIETWCEPVLAQIVKLIQYYESDPIVLGLCGEKAKLFQKFGVDEITDELLESDVTIRVNVGLGAGDPQQRLAKFQSAVNVAMPLLQMDPDFQSGKKKINSDEVMQEVFGGAGYRDGGKRFITEGEAKQNPMQGLEQDKMKSETEKNRAMAKKAVIDALANAAKVGLSEQDLNLRKIDGEFQRHVAHMDQVGRASQQGHDDAERVLARQNVAKGLAPDGSPIDTPQEEAEVAQIKAEMAAENGGAAPGADPAAAAAAPDSGGPALDAANSRDVPGGDAGHQPAPPRRRVIQNIKRGPDGRVSGLEVVDH